MVKKTKFILFLFIPFLISAGWFSGSSNSLGKYSVVTCDTSSVLLWWRAEAADFSGTNNDTAPCTGAVPGGADCSNNDEVWSLGGNASISAAAVKYGTNGLRIVDNYDYAVLDTPSVTLDDEGRVGFWFKPTTWANDAYIFTLYDDNNDNFRLRMDGTDELNIYWTDTNGANTEEITTTDANLSTGTYYFIEVAWKTSTNYLELFVNGVSKVSLSGTINSFDSAVVSIYLGTIADVNAGEDFDNVIISTDSTVDLYTVCKDETSWPG